MFRIGVISDTHNYLDPAVHRHFKGVDHILHAGDVCQHKLLIELEQIAPVTAVLGNNDSGMNLRLTEVVLLAGRKFLLHHIVTPGMLGEPLKSRVAQEKPDVVIFGHSHQPFNQTTDGTLFFNPGYAGKSRFGMERTLAILSCGEKELGISWTKLD